MVATLPSQDTDSGNGTRPTRKIERRVGLPSGRAVVGALLMTVAALGVFLAYAGASQDTRTDVVVASRDLPAGTTLSADDLDTARLDIDDQLSRRSFSDPSILVDQRLVAPVGEGELVQRSAVSETPADGPRNEFTFRLAASRAVNGDLAAGDLIDVYVTIDGTTRTVAREVALLGPPSDAGRGDLVLRVAIGDENAVLAVIDAVNRGEITVVRATHADNAEGLITTSDPQAPRTNEVDEDGG